MTFEYAQQDEMLYTSCGDKVVFTTAGSSYFSVIDFGNPDTLKADCLRMLSLPITRLDDSVKILRIESLNPYSFLFQCRERLYTEELL